MGIRRGDHDDLQLARLDAHEAQVRTDQPECLRDAVAAVVAHHHRSLPGRTVVFGDVAEERNAQFVLDVLAAADGGVENFHQVDDAERRGQTEQQCDEEDDDRAGRHGGAAAVGRIDDPGVVVGDGLGQFILLAFVQQVEVELLLDALLAGIVEQFGALAGRRSDARTGEALLAADVVQLDFERRDMRLERGDDRPPQRGQLAVEILDDGAVARCVAGEFVAAEHQLVVVLDLVGDRHVGDGDVGRDQVAQLGVVEQIVAYVLRHADLVLHRKTCGFELRTLGQALRGLRRDVVHLVVFLIGRDLAVYGVQFRTDDAQPLVDEVGRVVGDTVLVVDRLVVIAGDERVDDVLRTAGNVVVERNGDGVGLLLDQLDGDSLVVTRGHAAHDLFAHRNRVAEVVVGHVERRRHDEQSARRGDRVVEPPRHLDLVDLRILVLVGIGRGAVDELRERELLVVDGGQFERQRLPLVVVDEGDVDRRTAVEVLGAQPVFDDVVDVQVEPPYHFGHQVARFEHDDLVVDVAACRGSQQVAEGGDIRFAALLAVLDEDRSRAVVDFRRRVDIEKRARKADDRRQQEPEPVADDHLYEVVDREVDAVLVPFRRDVVYIAIFFHEKLAIISG